MSKSVRTVKAPSLKQNIQEDIKEQILKEVGHEARQTRREYEELLAYTDRRVQKLEDKNFEREISKLSIPDWCMIACYACIIIGTVIVTIRTLKKTSAYGHS